MPELPDIVTYLRALEPRVMGRPIAKVALRTPFLLRTVDPPLAAIVGRPVRALSRGMEQRLALARALLHAPDLLILDEPWTGLDAAAADLLDALLREQRAARRTVLLATHDLARGLALADRALVIHHGGIEWETRVDADALTAVDAVYRRVTNAVAA